MAVVIFRVRAWVRNYWRAGMLVGLLVGVIAGLVIGLAAGARRTASAPDRYTAEFDGDPDLRVYQLGGKPLDREVAAIDGVRDVQAISFVAAFPLPADGSTPSIDPEPWAGDDHIAGARVVEGRFTDPAATDEFTANAELVELLGAEVGDQVQMIAFDQEQVDANAFDNEPAVPAFDTTLVGITQTPADFDDPSPTMILSRGFLEAHPDVGLVWTLIDIRLDPDASADAVLDEIREIPGAPGFFTDPTQIISADARRAVRFQAIALWLVTAIAALVAAVVVGQLAGRLFASSSGDRRSLSALGWRRRDVALEQLVQVSLVAAVAWLVAAAVAFLVSGLFPLGALRRFEPNDGAGLDWTATGAGLVGVFAVIVLAGVLASWRLPERDDRIRSSGRLAGLFTGAGFTLATGAHFAATGASGRRRAAGAVALSSLGLAGLVGSAVVGLSVAHLVDDPGRWGVNYEQVFGNLFIPGEPSFVTPFIEDSNVSALSAVTAGTLTIEGRDVAVFAGEPIRGEIVPVALSGRAPVLDDEIGLGAEVARRLGVGIGDVVSVSGSEGASADLRVVGIVVTPDEAGNGAALTFASYAALEPSATQNVMLVRFGDDAPADAVERLAAASFTPPESLGTPTSVAALKRVVPAPFALAILLTFLLGVVAAYGLAMSVRARSRDLAVLRALGCNDRQLRAVIHWQASLLAALIVLVGLPFGVILGRRVVRQLTDTLGIVPGATVPVLLVIATPVIVLLAVNGFAWSPGRRATRTTTSELLRDR